MYINKILSFHYRNLEEITFNCNPNINCIIGQNGVGKTNILDSIYYLSFCKSNLLANDALNVKQGEDSFLIQGNYEIQNHSLKVSCAYQTKDKEKIFKCDDKRYTKFSDHIGLIPLIFISPSDISLINGSGTERRKFIDSYISLFDKEYLQNLVSYNKFLMQRNSILKQKTHIDYTYMSIIDEQLSIIGTHIFNTRKKAINELNNIVTLNYSKISTSDECYIEYNSQLIENEMLFTLQTNFERDKILTFTSIGIHRDDIVFHFNGGFLKNVGSQGQKKSFLLALKFAQYQCIKEKKKVSPILLLDDLFDKLDKERTSKVFDLIEGEDFGQIFITDTDKVLLHTFFEHHKNNGTFWLFENGKLKSST